MNRHDNVEASDGTMENKEMENKEKLVLYVFLGGLAHHTEETAMIGTDTKNDKLCPMPHVEPQALARSRGCGAFTNLDYSDFIFSKNYQMTVRKKLLIVKDTRTRRETSRKFLQL